MFFIGNAPIAHFSPPGGAGETHFLYRASYVEGSVKPAGKGVFTGASGAPSPPPSTLNEQASADRTRGAP